MAEFVYEDLLPIGPDRPQYRLLTTEGVRASRGRAAGTFLQVDPEALRLLTETAMHDIAHYLRPAHLAQLRRIIDDPDASNNDQFVALDLLKNANIAAGGVLPMCQDTGTAIVMGKRGQHVLTGRPGRRAGDRPGGLRRLHPAQPALLPDGARSRPGRRRTPAPTSPPRSSSTPTPPRGTRRPTSSCSWPRAAAAQQVLPLPGDQGRPEPRSACSPSSTRSCARSAPPPARRTTWPSSSAARAPSSP